jgi:two-component system, response regulator YesN
LNPIRKPRSFQIALFWRHFANYFVIILIPVIVACLLAHFLIVSLIEKDAQKLNNVVLIANGKIGVVLGK